MSGSLITRVAFSPFGSPSKPLFVRRLDYVCDRPTSTRLSASVVSQCTRMSVMLSHVFLGWLIRLAGRAPEGEHRDALLPRDDRPPLLGADAGRRRDTQSLASNW